MAFSVGTVRGRAKDASEDRLVGYSVETGLRAAGFKALFRLAGLRIDTSSAAAG
jgi:hypothetical protein